MTYLRIFFEGIKNFLFSLFDTLVAWLSFSSQIETMVDTVNHLLEAPAASIANRLLSHPGGYIRDLGKRRLTIAAAYIKIAHDHLKDDSEERLVALRMLTEQALHAKTF